MIKRFNEFINEAKIIAYPHKANYDKIKEFASFINFDIKKAKKTFEDVCAGFYFEHTSSKEFKSLLKSLKPTERYFDWNYYLDLKTMTPFFYNKGTEQLFIPNSEKDSKNFLGYLNDLI